ncbi:helix-turn-helix domain-containing protein [Paenibacillus apiarius]|uniref:helix-turn-helix domain-containing protein n=1 Tax=Paenibacillus apiarius TaxID=46240 RepID=UPI003B3B2EDE
MSNECKNVLPQRLREMRAKYGFNQEYVAEKVGLKRTNIANYESGRNVPPVDKLCVLADIYHTTIDYLVGRTNSVDPILQSDDIISIHDIKHLRLNHGGMELTSEEKEAIVQMLENMLAFKSKQ